MEKKSSKARSRSGYVKKRKSVFYPRSTLTGADVEIKAATHGRGLFAKRPLPPNAQLEFKGVVYTEPKYQEVLRESDSDPENKMKMLDYIISGPNGTYIDGNPRVFRGSLAAAANEPSQNQKANAFFKVGRQNPTMLVTARNIKSGEEILVCYGSSFERKYKIGRNITVDKNKFR